MGSPVAVRSCSRYRSEEYIGQISMYLERRRIIHLSAFQITEQRHKNACDKVFMISRWYFTLFHPTSLHPLEARRHSTNPESAIKELPNKWQHLTHQCTENPNLIHLIIRKSIRGIETLISCRSWKIVSSEYLVVAVHTGNRETVHHSADRLASQSIE